MERCRVFKKMEGVEANATAFVKGGDTVACESIHPFGMFSILLPLQPGIKLYFLGRLVSFD